MDLRYSKDRIDFVEGLLDYGHSIHRSMMNEGYKDDSDVNDFIICAVRPLALAMGI